VYEKATGKKTRGLGFALEEEGIHAKSQ